MEDESKDMSTREQVSQSNSNPGDSLYQGLDEAMFKLLQFQAQQGADQNSTMLMLALMNLLGIVNCMNKILPEGQRVRGTTDLAGQIAGILGGAIPPPPQAGNAHGTNGNPGGIDPAMIAALVSMLGGPRGPEDHGEGNRQGGIDPALLAALAGMLGGPGGGPGANPAALLSMLANFMPKRGPEAARPKEAKAREEKPEQPEEKAKPNEATKKEMGPTPRGMLKWDPRFGSPSSF